MIVFSCSLDSTLEQVKLQGSLRAVEERYQLFNVFGPVVLLTQDTRDFSHELSDISHVPCASSKFETIRKIFSRFGPIRWSFFSINSFFWLLRSRSRISFIISEHVDSPSPFLVSSIFKIPYFIHYHYDVATQVSEVNKHKVEGFLLLFLDRLCFKNATCVWATAPNLVEKAEEAGAKKVTLIPNWVNFTEPSKGRFDNADCHRIIFVGRLHPVKRVNLLIEAFSLLNKTFPNARLLIVGDGDERKNLEKLVKDLNLEGHVDFVGFQDHEKVLSLMSQSDMIVLPSVIEGNPRVLVEAMMLKVPVVATNVRGINDMVQHGETGYLVSRALPRDLAAAMNYILVNKEYSRRITENAYRYAKDQFSKEQVLKKIRKDILSSVPKFRTRSLSKDLFAD